MKKLQTSLIKKPHTLFLYALSSVAIISDPDGNVHFEQKKLTVELLPGMIATKSRYVLRGICKKCSRRNVEETVFPATAFQKLGARKEFSSTRITYKRFERFLLCHHHTV